MPIVSFNMYADIINELVISMLYIIFIIIIIINSLDFFY